MTLLLCALILFLFAVAVVMAPVATRRLHPVRVRVQNGSIVTPDAQAASQKGQN